MFLTILTMRYITLFIYQYGKQQCSNLTLLCICGMLQTIKITKDNYIKAYWRTLYYITALCDVGCCCCCLFACLIFVALLCLFACHIRMLGCHFIVSIGDQKGINKKGMVFIENFNVRFCSQLLTKLPFLNCWAALFV